MVYHTRKKRHLQRKKEKKRKQKRIQAVVSYLRYVRLFAGVHAYGGTIERRAADSMSEKKKRKRNKITKKTRDAREKQYEFEPFVANQLWRGNQLKHARSLVLPVTFGHITTCRSPALAFSAAIHLAMKRSASCSAVLSHSPSFWAAIVNWSALILKALRSSSRKHLIYSFSWPSTQPAPPHQFYEHHALRQSRVLHARHKSLS